MLLSRPQQTQTAPPTFLKPPMGSDLPQQGEITGDQTVLPPPVMQQSAQTLPPPTAQANTTFATNQPAETPTALSAPMPTAPTAAPAAPVLSPTELAQKKFDDLNGQQTPADNDKGFLRRLGATLREFGKKALLTKTNPNSSLSEQLWQRLGAGIGGAAGYQIDPQVDEREHLQNERNKAWQDYQVKLEEDKNKQASAGKQAQIDKMNAETKSIPIDDENRQLQIKNQRDTADERLRSQALNKLTSLKYFDLKNPAHKTLAEQAGINTELLKGWDDRDPKTKQIAGVTYQYDYNTKSFTPTKLPIEDSKTLTDYKIEMPNGEVRTYKVSQRDAASFSTQMSSLGARLEQDDRHFNQRINEEQAARKEATRKWVTQNKMSWARFQSDVNARVSRGDISQDEADKVLADFPEEFK